MQQPDATLTARIRDKALELGFDRVGFAPAQRARRADAFGQWLDRGYAGDMKWLHKDPERRSDPRKVVDGARSVITVGFSYYTGDLSPEIWDDPSRGRIARYAWGNDYHDELTPLLRQLAEFVRDEGGPDTGTRYYVDTGPVLEREIAAEAGLGFVGKNTLLIQPRGGSYLFLGEIITTLSLEHDPPSESGTCGSCTRCLDICPTHAFPAPYILDSRKCISYLTIELKDAIPEAMRPLLGNWIYGCDECQSVCPWVRRYAQPRELDFLRPDPEQAAPRLLELMALDDQGFRDRFRGTPMRRTKRRGLLRNVAVALGNWGDPSATPVLERALNDSEPLIQEHAAWALDRIE